MRKELDFGCVSAEERAENQLPVKSFSGADGDVAGMTWDGRIPRQGTDPFSPPARRARMTLRSGREGAQQEDEMEDMLASGADTTTAVLRENIRTAVRCGRPP